MRMSTGGLTTALLVPDTAVQTDQTRKLLLVVDSSGTVAAREVALGPLVGELRVIRSGIELTDRVVIEGVQMAVPGQKVRPEAGNITATEVPSEAASEPAAASASSATASTATAPN
jgi:multidrug efflux system membrane fusion protein